MAKGEFSPKVREMILERDNHCCARCGRYTSAPQIHHRAPRQMGGTRAAWIGLPSNGVTLCLECHGFIEKHREDAYDTGWLVRRHGTDRPDAIAIQHARYGYGWLTDAGGFDPYPNPFKKD